MTSKPGKRERARERKRRKAERRSRRREFDAANAMQGSQAPSVAEPKRGVEAQAIDPSLRWHIARMQPRMGEKAMEALKKAKVATIRLRTSEVVVRRGRRVIRRVPLVPRTVFVGVEHAAHLAEVEALAGIAEIVAHPEPDDRSGGNVPGFVMRPARLDPAALQRFAEALAAGEITQPVGVKPGQNVVMLDGPFATFPGIVEELLPCDRVKVGVAIFGRSSPVEVGLAQIQVIT